jgi:putative flippase GtrA
MNQHLGRRKLLRYVLVGVLNTAFALVVYWLFLWLGFGFRWAAAFSLICGIIFSFKSHSALVFRSAGSFGRYLAVWTVVYAANIGFIAAVRDTTGDFTAGVAALPLNVVLGFVLLNHFVFNESRPSASSKDVRV